ncbi:hypothetical protein, conserved [Babesia bigemina]|uniref:CAAX prenyl protease 2/Lysostaphin resistance protein A-like domain-containing protein n=1 Tax=Babesia bigemina TaxID=5866 RepID=A0A061D8P2_BABBI|nr:hypothetical protein, conserved [Babesia bigemina]CDR96307.1 hypothetical protein, conserved [Babesia bigemina]|eukprot:XP_012768493.1 hypothetical protein, conserved [Babesia bigemina]
MSISRWRHLGVYLSLIWYFVAVCDSLSTTRTAKCVLGGGQGVERCVSRYQPAFLNTALVPVESRRNGRTHGSQMPQKNDRITTRKSESHLCAISNDVGLYDVLSERRKAVSKIICHHVDRALQKLKESTLCKQLKHVAASAINRMSALSTKEQIGLAILGEIIYAFYLPNFHILFPYQIIPVNSGLGVDVGLDTITSIVSGYYLWISMQKPVPKVTLNLRQKFTIPLVAAGLLGSFYLSGYTAQAVDNGMLLFSAMDFPISVALQRSARILISHLSWVLVGAKMLSHIMPLKGTNTEWFAMNPKDLWVYKALAGYFVSCTIYNITDVVFNAAQALKKKLAPNETDVDDEMMEGVLIEPSELFPAIIASLGPCLTAPWWEEMLYRIFTFKALNVKLPRRMATVLSAFIFAAHHMNPRSLLQLFGLGILWSLIEQGTNNVFVNIAIHSMWNTRIMLGTLLGR